MITPHTQLEAPFLAAPTIDITEYINDEEKLATFIHDLCVKQGTPVVFTNLQALPGWNKDLFQLERTAQLYGDQGISIERPEAPMAKKILPLGDYVAMIQNPRPHTEEPATMDDLSKASSSSTPPLDSMSPSKLPSPASPSQPPSIPGSQVGDSPAPDDTPRADSKETAHDMTLDMAYSPTPLCITSLCKHSDKSESSMIADDSDFMMDYLDDVQVSISERIQTGARRRKCRNEGQKKQQLQQEAQQAQSKLKRPKLNHKQQHQQNHGWIDKSLYYAKDMDCLDEYKECLSQILPPSLLPLGESDLIRTLPSSLQAINLLCYLGGDNTGTALHRDISGAVGHNIMTYGDESAYAQWLVIKKDESQKLRKLCQEATDIDDIDDSTPKKRRYNKKDSYFLECEQACVSYEQLTNHDIATYVIFQRPGDLVVIPSLCYHQVSNMGVSFKMAWNRITPHSLLEGIKLQLPLYRIIGRPELYRCKATIYFTIKDILNNLPTKATFSSPAQRQMFLEKCRLLLHLFATDVIRPEIIESIPIENVDNKGIIHEDDPLEKYDHHGFDVVCDFCNGDVFCRYYHCERCDMDLCLDCYGMGRSCPHVIGMSMHESLPSGVANNGEKDMVGYIDLYEETVDRLNSNFGPGSVVPEITPFYHRGDKFSLATTCRRIEMYRRKHKYLSNMFYCSHCESVFDMKDFNSDPKSIFELKPCSISLNSSPNSTVFVCDACSQRCLICNPSIRSVPIKTDLVYFRDMSSGCKLWGGYVDIGLFKTSSWPDYKAKINTSDTDSGDRLSSRSWHYPEDFMSLAAAELIKHITPEGWKHWGSGESSIPDLIQRLAQNWTNRYKKELHGSTIPNDTVYEINPQKKKLGQSFIDTTGLSLKVPTI